jgi:hypothetical protein
MVHVGVVRGYGRGSLGFACLLTWCLRVMRASASVVYTFAQSHGAKLTLLKTQLLRLEGWVGRQSLEQIFIIGVYSIGTTLWR